MVGLRVRVGGVNTDRMVCRSATMTNRTKATRWIMCMNGQVARARSRGVLTRRGPENHDRRERIDD
ncbi:MAG: hypothetical protein QOC89_863 [Paraburkholderia sp.]|nr:hypothetical protein [Paraburkholderia sp.]